MPFIHIGRSYEVEDGPKSATAENIRIGFRNWALSVRWKSAQDGRTPCLYVDLCLAEKWFRLINRPPKE